MVKLSVIIPGYNTPECWWRRCIASVKAASPSAEIICIDDGSVDGAKFLDLIDGIRVVHQDNAGPSVARNRGLSMASGEWISFVDSDDEVLPDMFSSMISRAEKDSSDICICGVKVIWPEEGLEKDDFCETAHYGELRPKDVKKLADACILNYIWNKIYSRDFIARKKLSFPLDAVMGEDLIFNFDCISNGARWSNVNTIGYRYYRTHMTLLSRYKPSLISGLMHYSEVWRKYKASYEDGECVLGRYGEMSSDAVMKMDRRNMWMPGSPVPLRKRFSFGTVHSSVMMMAFSFARKYLYFRFLRRMIIKRNYPKARRMAVIYPSLSNRDLGVFRIGGAGLANNMFVAARAVLLTRRLAGVMLRPTWERFGVGQFIRRERDKRLYRGLFRRDSLMNTLYKSTIIRYKRFVRENDICDASRYIKVEGLGSYYKDIIEGYDIVRGYFESNILPSAIARVPKDLSAYIAIHIRLGDYLPELRVPLQWYIDMVNLINEKCKMKGMHASFILFSDGSDKELKDLLDMENIHRAKYGNAIADIVAISRCRALIGSDSTFSGWGAYLGQIPSVFKHFYPGCMLRKAEDYCVMEDANCIPEDFLEKFLPQGV